MARFFMVFSLLGLTGALYLARGVRPAKGASDALPTEVSEQLLHLKRRWTVSLDKDIAFFYANSLARTYFAHGRLADGLWYAEWLSERFPGAMAYTQSAYWYDRAHAAAQDNETQQAYANRAREYYMRLLASCPTDHHLRFSIARTYLSSRRPMQGIRLLKEILAEDPLHADALYHLGLLSARTEQYEKAIGYFGRLLALHPTHTEAMLHLGHAYLMDGQQEEGERMLQQVKKISQGELFIQRANSYLGEDM